MAPKTLAARTRFPPGNEGATCAGRTRRRRLSSLLPKLPLLVLGPLFLVAGSPLNACAAVATIEVGLIDRAAANPPAEAPHWILELPSRALAVSGPRILPYAATLPAPLILPPAAEDRLRMVRSISTDSAESSPRSPRAPPPA
jgi:hypothetical protein